MKNIALILSFAFSIATSTVAHAAILKMYPIGKTSGPLLFTQKKTERELGGGKKEYKSIVTDSAGKEVYNEVIVAKGSMPLKQSAEMGQTKRHLEIEVKGDRLFFRTRSNSPENDEKPKESEEALPKNLISGALAEQFAIENWNAIMAGETVYAKMAIMEIRELVSFKFWKKEITKFNGRDVAIVMLKPSSIFISLIVDPITLFIDMKEKKMVHYIGRTPMWKTVNGDLKALDAEIVFE
jgi:hypothetical protein